LPTFRLSRRAKADLLGIAVHTLKKWGEAQSDRYGDELVQAFQRLAGSPLLGRQCPEPHEFLRRFEHGKHVIFYQPEKQGVLIVRVLHERMLTQMHLM